MYDEDEDAFAEFGARASHRLRSRERKTTKRKRPQKNRDNGAATASRDAPTIGGVVIEAQRAAATVVTPTGDLLSAQLDARVLRAGRGALAVGDDVVVARDPSGVDLVIRVGARRTVLARRHTQRIHDEQVIVANVDVVGIVAAATSPPLRPRLVDRYLIAIRRGGAVPVLIVNKLDDADAVRRQELEVLVAPYRAVDVPVHLVSAESGEGLDGVRAELAGVRCALVGHSGVGKSSLVRALGAEAVVGGLADHGRGRHTTTSSMLHRIPTDRGLIEMIDTPGIRQFGLLGLTTRELGEAFPELAALVAGCAYSNCTHTGESDCAVQQALERGELSEARYDSYVRLLAHTSD